MKRIIIFLIKCYQILPLSSHNMCRFTPTCSEYAILSLEKYGTIKGLKIAFKRFLRCRPGGKFGYDPIPNEEV